MKKKTINSELVYLFAIIILSFSIDLMTIANMGLSAINGPAYILSKITYLSSFITGILYATMADVWKIIFPFFQNQYEICFQLRIIYFLIGFILSAIAIALFYKSYLYPQIYDFFVQEMSKKYHLSLKVFKTGFDCIFLILSFIMSFMLFHGIVGIGIGTMLVALFNGILIDFFKNFFDKHFVCIPKLTKLAEYLKL